MRYAILISLLLTLLGLTSAKKYTKAQDAVLLSNVRTLTLHGDKQTSHRRVKAIPQLNCVGGNAKSLYNVDVMRCKNSGSEYDTEDIQWTCQASLPPEFKLGSTEVVCEGFDGPDDPYILKGSCGVEYRLVLTEMGEEKYSRKFSNQKSKPTQYYDGDGKTGTDGMLEKFWTVIFWAIFIAVVCIILYKLFNPNQAVRLPNAGRFGGGWGGGGGGGDDNDPPPPYTPRAPPRSNPSNQNSARKSNPTRSSGSRSNNSGPGFWTGAATGGAAGYGAGYFMGNRDRERQRGRENQSAFGAPGGSSWFGGGGSSGGGAGGGSSNPGPSSSRCESSGFGGTRRR